MLDYINLVEFLGKVFCFNQLFFFRKNEELRTKNVTIVQENTSRNTLFPIFLKLDTLDVLLVGGGNVGLEKLSAGFTYQRCISLHESDTHRRTNSISWQKGIY